MWDWKAFLSRWVHIYHIYCTYITYIHHYHLFSELTNMNLYVNYFFSLRIYDQCLWTAVFIFLFKCWGKFTFSTLKKVYHPDESSLEFYKWRFTQTHVHVKHSLALHVRDLLTYFNQCLCKDVTNSKGWFIYNLHMTV